MKIAVNHWDMWTILFGCTLIGVGLESFGAFLGVGAIIVSLVEYRP